jgi:protein-tyrosine-phosphatase
VDSAGTTSHIKVASPEMVEILASYGCDASGHVQIRITPEFLAQQDLIICMAEHHRERLREL